MTKRVSAWLLAAGGLVLAGTAHAQISAEDAARLGQDLTPVGAQRAGNDAGTIPEWTPLERRGSLQGFYPNVPEVADDEVKFVITAENMEQYKDHLSEGHKKLLSTYPDSYKMEIFPSRRIVAWPEEIYAATKKNATDCKLIDPDNIDNCNLGFPFPIPQTGAEPLWNHRLKWRGNAAIRYNNQAIVQRDGSYQFTKIVEDVVFSYANTDNPRPITRDSGEFLRYLSETVAPTRLAGTFILVHERAGTGEAGRSAWLYSPGLRRIRRAPSVCCDNPYEGTDGHQFYDQVDMFNGVKERFTVKLVGKREMYIPYNSYRIVQPEVSVDDLASPRHLNQDLPRYEKHRVWVVEMENKRDLRHTFGRKTLYLDEDSWNIVMVDNYDQRGSLMQFQEGHLAWASNVMATGTSPEVIYHFNTGRYFLTAMMADGEPIDFTPDFDDGYFTAASVQRRVSR